MAFQAPPPPPPVTPAPAPAPAPAGCVANYPLYVNVDNIVENSSNNNVTATLNPYPSHVNNCATITNNTITFTGTTNQPILIYFFLTTKNMLMADKAISPKNQDNEFSTSTTDTDGHNKNTISAINYEDTPASSGSPHSFSIFMLDSSQPGKTFTFDPKIQNQPPTRGVGIAAWAAIVVATLGILAVLGLYLRSLFRRGG